MNRFLARVKAYLDRGDTPPPAPERVGLAELFPPGPGPSSAAPSALDRLDGHYADARAVVDAGRGRHAVDTTTRLMPTVPADLGPLLATGPDVRPAFNVALARQVLQHITAYPWMWDQHTWWQSNECGTTGDFAGWAVYFGRPDVQIDNVAVRPVNGDDLIGWVPGIAQALLGLTDEQTTLFDPTNSLRDLWTLAAEWSLGKIVVPEQLPDGS